MPRKAEPSFELKKIVWDMAAKGYKDKYSAIQRHLDRVLPEQELNEDTPDIRTIKRIIDEDINELSREVVVSELPNHVWSLRNDYENIKQLAGGTSQALQKENIVDDEKAKSLEVMPNEIEVRIQRILTTRPAYEWPVDGEFKIELLDSDEYITLPQKQGNFRVYLVRSKGWPPYTRIAGEGLVAAFEELWYIAKHEGDIDLETAISDISVLMHRCSDCGLKVTFIIATGKDLVSERDNIYHQFQKLRNVIDGAQEPLMESSFSLEIWDCQGLLEKEKQLGLRLDL